MNTFHATKILVVGDGGVGKTCAIERAFGGDFQKQYIPGDRDHELHEVRKDWNNFIIYDFPGQRRFDFKELTADIKQWDINYVVIMYDLNSPLSRKSRMAWMECVKEKFGEIPYKLVGTKTDIGDQAIGICANNDYKTSAKNKTNLDCIFHRI